jgi:hypothetical protein
MASIRTGSNPSGGWLVSALFLVVSGRRTVARRARLARRSRHGVALGPAVCARNGATFALQAQTEQRQLARGRNLHPGQGQVGLFILDSEIEPKIMRHFLLGGLNFGEVGGGQCKRLSKSGFRCE